MARPLINDPSMTHFMIDIETLSISPRAYIASLACSVFEPWSDVVPDVDKVFKGCVGLNDPTQALRDIDLTPNGTVWWWLNQNYIAIDRALHQISCQNLADLFDGLQYYMDKKQVDPNMIVIWTRGLSFDPAILRDAYQQFMTLMPWKFWNELDVRSLENFMLIRNIAKWTPPAISGDYDPVVHDPVYDVLDQIRQVQYYLKSQPFGVDSLVGDGHQENLLNISKGLLESEDEIEVQDSKDDDEIPF